MLSHLSNDRARMILAEGRVGRLGCVTEDGPYVVPVCYVFDGKNIYVHSLPGSKINALRSDPRTCLQVDERQAEDNWQSAIAFGKYEEVSEPDERTSALRQLLERFPHLTPVESVPVHDGQSSIIVFRIRISHITGVAEG